MVKAVIIHPSDNVACLTEDGKAGETYEYELQGQRVTVTLQSDIPFGHKFALRPLENGALVLKYGRPIGAATEAIVPGAHVHVHNCAGLRGRGDLQGGHE